MTESAEKTLAIKITPKLDMEELTRQIKSAVNAALATGQITRTTVEQEQGPTGGGGKKEEKVKTGGDDSKKKIEAIRAVGQVAKTGFNIAQQTFNGIFNIIKDLHARVKQSSAFLASVENLFNLAVTLLLMPLGNAIADTILPATVELVESVVGLWEKFEEYAGTGDLKSIISTVMNEGLKLIGQYINNIGDIFIDTGDTLLGSIGHLFTWLGGLLETGKIANVLETLFSIFTLFAENMNTWIPMIVGFMAGTYGATMLSSIPLVGSLIGGSIGFATGAGVTAAYLNTADGGMIPHTEGGQTIRVAEHENEYIIPESKLNLGGTGGNNNYYVTINGYTSEEVKQYVRDVLRDEISGSQFRSGI